MADGVGQPFGLVAGVFPAEHFVRELGPGNEAGIHDLVRLRNESVVGGADAEQRPASIKMRTDGGHLILRWKTTTREEDEQVGILQRLHDSGEVMRLRLVTLDEGDAVAERLQLLLREIAHRGRRVVVVRIFDRHHDDVRRHGGSGGHDQERERDEEAFQKTHASAYGPSGHF